MRRRAPRSASEPSSLDAIDAPVEGMKGLENVPPSESLAMTFPGPSSDRLDRALAGGFPQFSRAALQRWVREGRVEVGGSVQLDPSTSVRAGTALRVRPGPRPTSDALPEDLPLHVLHEDDDVVVLDKAAGMVVHPAAGHASGTLVNALLFRYGSLATGSDASDDEDTDDEDSSPETPVRGVRPGIVHRLDRWTSGVMVVARTDRGRAGLMTQFAEHSIDRAYLAIVEGRFEAARTFSTLHGRHPTDRKRFTTRISRGKHAVTHVEPLEVWRGATLVRCTLETGRTHQIRVHLAEHGFPLLGDAVYGRTPADLTLRELARSLGRQALHATLLGFAHPTTGGRVRFESPPPRDLQDVIDTLRRDEADATSQSFPGARRRR